MSPSIEEPGKKVAFPHPGRGHLVRNGQYGEVVPPPLGLGYFVTAACAGTSKSFVFPL